MQERAKGEKKNRNFDIMMYFMKMGGRALLLLRSFLALLLTLFI